MVELAIPKGDVAILRDAPPSAAIDRARVAAPRATLAVRLEFVKVDKANVTGHWARLKEVRAAREERPAVQQDVAAKQRVSGAIVPARRARPESERAREGAAQARHTVR
jgi:hypothetical protein